MQVLSNNNESGLIVPFRNQIPFPHQSAAVQSIVQTFTTQNRCHIAMACGTGKTRIGLWTAEEIGARSVLIFLPSLALINQTLHEWLEVTHWKTVSYLVICSDKTVTHGIEEEYLELESYAFPVTTEPSEIHKFLARKWKGISLIFCTYQSSMVLAKGAKKCLPFDFAIFDEAHRTSGIEGRAFSLGLNDRHIRIKKRLFMTATPKHYSIHSKHYEPRLIYSMDDQKIYGPRAYSLSFRDAINKGLLSKYKVIISIMLRQPRKKNTKHLEMDKLAVALEKSIKLSDVKKIISFHSSVKKAEKFIQNINRKNVLKKFLSLHVNSFMPMKRRVSIINLFKKKNKSLISNARCLTEGTNIPAVNMVAFLNPKHSKIDIVQAIGRALRKSPGKTSGYIFLPLFVERKKGERIEEAVERTNYGEIWEVLQALAEYDEDLHTQIQFLRQEKGRTETIDLNGLSEFIDIQNSEENVFLEKQLRRSIYTSILNRIGNSWDEMYGRLCKLYEKNKHYSIPRNPDRTLHHWGQTQRSLFRRGELSQRKIVALNAIKFLWNPLEEQWQNNYQALFGFYNKQGHCNVKYSENQSLLAWTKLQRSHFSKHTLSKERIDLLNEINFNWTSPERKWEKRYEELKFYKEKHGNCNVPKGFVGNKPLNIWVTAQRQKRKKHLLSEERIKRLEQIGFDWHPVDNQWEKCYKELKKYKKKYGDCNVPQEFSENLSLGSWIQKQRRGLRQNTLSKEKIDKLNQLEFYWNPKETQWKKYYEELKKYKKKYGDCNVPQKFIDNPSLGIWVGGQRRSLKQNTLSKEKIKKLDQIGFQWKPIVSQWEKYYEELKKYKNKYGNCKISTGVHKNASLLLWIRTQRKNGKNGVISKERVNKLDQLGFDWDPFENLWEKYYEELKEYKKKYGNCKIPFEFRENPSLALWVGTQRKSRKKGILSKEKIEKLDQMGFDWDPFENLWEKNYKDLQQYKKKHGDCNVPRRFLENITLANWVLRQRQNLKQNILSEEKIKKLNEIGFSWSLRPPRKNH